MNAQQQINAVKQIYKDIKPVIDKRLRDFRNVWEKGSQERVLQELVFCIFTPQSKAKNCWKCVEKITEKRLLIESTPQCLLKLEEINGVRFKNNKSRYMVEARNKFVKNGKVIIKDFLRQFSDVYVMREWLVDNIKGYGYKEASHFLRNIGFGYDIAILDRHILKNLVLLGVISEVPKTIGPAKYLEIETKMKKFSKKTGIPMDGLDLVLWYREAGEVFK